MTDSSQHRHLVLVVDDDPVTRLLAEETLIANGYRVVLAADSDEAMTLVRLHNPDAILTDINMPGRDGIELVLELRQSDWASLPIIVMTACDDSATVMHAYEAGATDFVIKPIRWSSVPYRMKHAIDSTIVSDALQEQRGRFETLLAALPDEIFLIHEDGLVSENLTGRRASAVDSAGPRRLDNVLPQHVVSEAKLSLSRALNEQKTASFEYPSADKRRMMELRIIPESTKMAIGMLRDVSDRHSDEQRIRKLAYYDMITGLPNRQLFTRRLRRTLQAARIANTQVGLLYIDLDQFKRINDTLGHSVGDALLKSVAVRLHNVIESTDSSLDSLKDLSQDLDPGDSPHVARLGGDEFVVLLPNLDSQAAAGKIAALITEAMGTPFTLDARQIVITPSIGISVFPQDGDDLDTLLKHADTAMFKAKGDGRNGYRFYDSTMEQRALDSLDLEGDLRQAINDGELSLHYQPRVCLNTGALCSAEALLRWHHPTRGWVEPEKIIAVAEDTGLILPLGTWVIQQACRQLGQWQSLGIEGFSVSVNVSADQVTRTDLSEIVLRAVWENRLKPQALELEITESAVMQDANALRALFAKLKNAGVRVVMDDFGTGYSALSYLREFAFDGLKIDRSFVMNLHNDDDSSVICAAIVAMANTLNLKVTAEGVELDEHRVQLAAMGCDEAQGFLYSKALPPQQFCLLVEDWLAAERRDSALLANIDRDDQDLDAINPGRE